jgi:hypothetical protein
MQTKRSPITEVSFCAYGWSRIAGVFLTLTADSVDNFKLDELIRQFNMANTH